MVADEGEGVHRQYEPSEDRRLSTAILDAVEAHTGDDIAESEFRLYDSIDPDALDSLFRHDARAGTTVYFEFGDVSVALSGDGGVSIRVTDRRE